MPTSDYDDRIVYALKRRMWRAAYDFHSDLKAGKAVPGAKTTVSGLELLSALHIMEEETRHHWVEDKKVWNDILRSSLEKD